MGWTPSAASCGQSGDEKRMARALRQSALAANDGRPVLRSTRSVPAARAYVSAESGPPGALRPAKNRPAQSARSARGRIGRPTALRGYGCADGRM